METKTKEDLRNRMIKWLQKNPINMYWDYREHLTDEQVHKILSNEDGYFEVQQEIWEFNFDYLWELEMELMAEFYEEFEDELEDEPALLEFQGDKDDIIDYLREEFMDYIDVDMNFNDLVRNTPDQVLMVRVHSNYDCTTSWDDVDEPENYLSMVWKRVKHAINKEDYLREFANSYTASLLVFPVKMSIEEIIELRKEMKLHKDHIIIPEGTQFGFFSSFNGSGSMFEHYTKEDLYLEQEDYDGFDIVIDSGLNYSMDKVYGGTNFVEDGIFWFNKPVQRQIEEIL